MIWAAVAIGGAALGAALGIAAFLMWVAKGIRF